MSETFTLYGVRADSLDEAADLVSARVEIQLTPREGLQMGGPYFSFNEPGAGVVLKFNLEMDGEIDEQDFPDEKFILYIDNYPSDSPFNQSLRKDPITFKILRRRER